MSARNDLLRMADWLGHVDDDGSGVLGCSPDECHKCITLRAIEEIDETRDAALEEAASLFTNWECKDNSNEEYDAIVIAIRALKRSKP